MQAGLYTLLQVCSGGVKRLHTAGVDSSKLPPPTKQHNGLGLLSRPFLFLYVPNFGNFLAQIFLHLIKFMMAYKQLGQDVWGHFISRLFILFLNKVKRIPRYPPCCLDLQHCKFCVNYSLIWLSCWTPRLVGARCNPRISFA